jgi:hypothetical protein
MTNKTSEQKVDRLEKEVKRLKVIVELLERYLATANALPILGPHRRAGYDLNKKKALEDAGLSQ